MPGTNTHVLSPQHWAKHNKKDNKFGVGCETYADRSVLFWDNRKFKRTVFHSKHDQCATFHLEGGFNKFRAFCTEVKEVYEKERSSPILCEEINIIKDDEEKFNKLLTPTPSEPCNFDLMDTQAKPINNIPIFKNEEPEGSTDEATLLQCHQKFGHISFARLKRMSQLGIIPS